MKKLLMTVMFLIVTFTTLSQDTKKRIKIGKDSTTVSNKALRSMQKESRFCDSVKVALSKKNELILNLTDSNLKMFKEFSNEREKKNEAIKRRDIAKMKLDKFDRKRFGVGISLGATVNSNFKIKPAFLIGINYSIFRF